jgi:2-aminoadipate transaminase
VTTVLPDVQYELRPGVIEFRSGHPDLGLLPAQGLLEATRVVVEREPHEALSYGAEQGPGCLIRQLQAWLAREEGVAPPAERLMITGGSSQGLDMCCMILTRPGDVALVQSPTYHLALRVLRDHQLDLVPVASDGEGVRLDALEKTLLDCQANGRPAKLLYLVSTFNNPSGVSLSTERREELAVLAQRFGITVIEDDVYHQLWYDSPPPPSVYDLAPEACVVRLGSFSKILAPGLRLGWMSAPPEIVERCKKSGVLDSGGGLGHFTAHVVAAFMELGLLDQHIETLRATYRDRLSGLIQGLEKHLPESCSWLNPGGGFFLWLRLPPVLKSSEVLPVAEGSGVSYIPGPLFYADGGGEPYCRLNFTMWPLSDIAEGTRRLGRVLHDSLAHLP